MHARHRSPGNGYRSNSMGMTPSSRISPEGSMRSHGFYNSEYRSFNRSFGRNHGHGQLKAFQPPQPPLPRRGDIFMEAGRLAAEYLVSQGLLPPSALSGKWQNGSSFKKQLGDFQDYRSQEGDGVQFSGEGRISGHLRLGDANVDGGSGRRRYSDDYGTGGWRNNMKGKRRGGSFRGNNSDWGRDYGRSSSWSDRYRASPDYNNNSRHREEQPVAKEDAMMLDKSSMDVSAKNDDTGDSKPNASENELKEIPQLPNVDNPNETDGEVINEPDDSNNLNEKTGEMKNTSENMETVKQIVQEESPSQQCTTKMKSSERDDVDLQTLCKFANVPTRTRSSRGTKGDRVFGGEENSSNTAPSRGSEIVGEEDALASTSAHASSTHNNGLRAPVPEKSKEPVAEPFDESKGLSPVRDYEQCQHVSSEPPPGMGKLSPTCNMDQGICLNTSSFPEKTTMPENDQEVSADLQGFGSLSSLVEKRGEKRDFEDDDVKEGNKRTREWLSSMVGNMDDFFRVSNSGKMENDTVKANITSNKPSIETADQKSSAGTSQLSDLRDSDKPCPGYMQEKQFFPGSFKICDLNLMETSELNENHEGEPVFMYPSIPEFKKEVRPVDIDLSISNSSTSLERSRHVVDGRDIEIIDLENDSGTEDKALEPERKMETTYTGMEGFSNPPQNAADIPDGQENYGLMISELLGNDFSNCAAVPDEINPLDNVVLHNGEETLADDDSIYMSLGEIPLLGFMRNWEQAPPQEDGKPF